MTDLESVIRELETLGAWHTHHYAPFHYEAAETIHDAIVLLKEQKPVEPIKEPLAGSNYAIWQCGNCKAWLRITDKFCGRCGKAVKRNG